MRKCSSAPQLAGNERQLHVGRAGSRGLTVKTGTNGAGSSGSRSKASGSCNALVNMSQVRIKLRHSRNPGLNVAWCSA